MPTDDELRDMYLAAAKDAGELFSQSMGPGLRAVYEAGIDEGEASECRHRRRLAELLDELTDGRMSKTNYDVRTMVREVEEAFDRHAQEEIAEAVAAERERIAATLDLEEVNRLLYRYDRTTDFGVREVHAAILAAIGADREPEPATDAWAEGFEAGAGRKPRFGEVKNRRRYDDEPEPATEATPEQQWQVRVYGTEEWRSAIDEAQVMRYLGISVGDRPGFAEARVRDVGPWRHVEPAPATEEGSDQP